MTFRSFDLQGEQLRDDADLVLHHEHLLIDLTCWAELSSDPATTRPVALADLADVTARPWSYPDNLRLDDVEMAVEELTRVGASRPAIIDVTPTGLGGSLDYLRVIAERSGWQVFLGCGRYVESARGGEVNRGPSWYRDEILEALLVGRDGVRAAVIGEIGTSTPITKLEHDSLVGAAQAQATTGAPLLVHVDLWNPSSLEALDIVERAGGDISRTIVCHSDCSLLTRGTAYHLEILNRGAMIAFDTWGDELEYGGNPQPTDEQRIEALLRIAEAGYGDRVLHSHDICTKTQLAHYGGPGYGHLSRIVFPRLRELGLSEADLAGLFLTPARRLLLGADH